MGYGGGMNNSLKADPYTKEQRKRYGRSLEDFDELRDWLSDQAEDWGELKSDAKLGNRLTRADFQKLIDGADAEDYFKSQQSRGSGMFGHGLGIRPGRGMALGHGATAMLLGMGLGGSGHRRTRSGAIGGLAGAALGGWRNQLSDDDYMDQITEGDLGYMDEQTMNDITRREGFSDVAPWQEVENSGWGGDEWIRNPYSEQNKSYYEEHGGRQEAVERLGQDNYWAKPEEHQGAQDYWKWPGRGPEHRVQTAETQEMTQAAQKVDKDKDQD